MPSTCRRATSRWSTPAPSIVQFSPSEEPPPRQRDDDRNFQAMMQNACNGVDPVGLEPTTSGCHASALPAELWARDQRASLASNS